MNKQEFIFQFPMSGETITRQMNLLAVKDATINYLRKQSEVRGNICMVFNGKEELVAMAYINERMKVSFFTEDSTICDIKEIGEITEEDINGITNFANRKEAAL